MAWDQLTWRLPPGTRVRWVLYLRDGFTGGQARLASSTFGSEVKVISGRSSEMLEIEMAMVFLGPVTDQHRLVLEFEGSDRVIELVGIPSPQVLTRGVHLLDGEYRVHRIGRDDVEGEA